MAMSDGRADERTSRERDAATGGPGRGGRVVEGSETTEED